MRLLYSERAASLDAARERERQLKRWSSQKKQALIAGDRAGLKRLGRSRQPRRKQGLSQ